MFSLGACPMGPRRLDPRHESALTSARFESLVVTREDAVFADDDGVVFAPLERLREVVSVADEIRATERRQAEALGSGRTLREQLRFPDYLRERAANPSFSFRDNLRRIGGAIEE